MNRRVNLRCETCNQEFTRKFSGLKKSRSGHYFCSRNCKDRAGRLGGIPGINPSLKSGRYADYRREFSRAKLVCRRCGYNEFPSTVHVHHIDEDRTNHSEQNLMPLCACCHFALHNNLWKMSELFSYLESLVIYAGQGCEI